ncbi:MAG: HAD-IC family P-type ATPase, partial [Bacteroidota bacterium]
MEKKDYIRQPINDLIGQLETDADKGLNESAVEALLKLHGPNTIQSDRSLGRIREFLALLKNPLVLTLLAAGAISMALGEQISGGIIFGIVMLSIITDYWQERDARNAAERLKNEVKTRAQVMREGKLADIDPETLVPGDILMLGPGNIVSADGRIISSNDLHINQASLTGESYPVEKSTNVPPPGAINISDWGNMVFMGSSVVSGTAKVLVLETGRTTQFGKIAASLVREPEQTDFSKGIQAFGNLILRVTIVLVLFIFLANSILKHNFLESFLFAVAVAVGLTPEMLPMIMSVTMAKGSVKMAKKGVIVKKLAAIPNFGSMEVLCTDKTGTLTEGEIHLVKHLDINGEDSDKVFELTYFNSFFQNGVPDPLDAAILRHANFKPDGWAKVDEVPFDFSRKRESVALRNPDGENILLCKGAPEEIFKIIKSDAAEIARCLELCNGINKEGFRVLALASKLLPQDQTVCTKQDEQGLELQGFVAFLDPPKPGAGEVIRQLADIGVEVKIIT